MKCIVINPWLKTITEGHYDPKDIKTLLFFMHHPGHMVKDVRVQFTFPNNDNLISEKETTLVGPCFSLGPLRTIGVGLIMGSDGNSWGDPAFLMTDLQDRIRWK